MASIATDAAKCIKRNWDLDMTLGQWWRCLADEGLAFPAWPNGLGGRSADRAATNLVAGAFAEANVIGPPAGVGQNLAGPTIAAVGSDEMKERFLPALADGREGWCQLFSEPEAGSDLASLRTRAELDGDHWVVNGQKIWNSGASLSERGMLLARTDGTVPKRQGISYFVVDMEQPGVETRPLRQMNGTVEFDEVFLTDAIVPTDRLVGELGGGWKVAQTTLAFERSSIGGRRAGGLSFPAGGRHGLLETAVRVLIADARQCAPTSDRMTGYMLRTHVIEQVARDAGVIDDPVIRQQLMKYRSMIEINRWTAHRINASVRVGGHPGPESSIGKLAISQIARACRDLALTILGAGGMLAGDDAPYSGDVAHVVLSSFAAGIGGGTDEIQRNVIGERALGLPREPDVDGGRPFDRSAGSAVLG